MYVMSSHNCLCVHTMYMYIVTIGFNEVDMTVDEDAGTINVPVSLAQEIAVPVTVDFMIVSGTAMEGPANGQYI